MFTPTPTHQARSLAGTAVAALPRIREPIGSQTTPLREHRQSTGKCVSARSTRSHIFVTRLPARSRVDTYAATVLERSAEWHPVYPGQEAEELPVPILPALR